MARDGQRLRWTVGGDQDHGQAGGGLGGLLDRLVDRLALEPLAQARVFQVGGEQDQVGPVVAGVGDQGVGAVVGGQPAPGVDAGLAGGGHLAGEGLAASLTSSSSEVVELGALGLGGPLVGHGVAERRGRVAVVQDHPGAAAAESNGGVADVVELAVLGDVGDHQAGTGHGVIGGQVASQRLTSGRVGIGSPAS